MSMLPRRLPRATPCPELARFGTLVGQSAAMRDVFARLARRRR